MNNDNSAPVVKLKGDRGEYRITDVALAMLTGEQAQAFKEAIHEAAKARPDLIVEHVVGGISSDIIIRWYPKAYLETR